MHNPARGSDSRDTHGERPPLDVGTLIDERPISVVQCLVAVLCGLCMFLDGYDIQALALAVPSLSQEWHLPPTEFGLALSAVVIGIVIGGALLAPLGDRLGRRTLVIGGMLIVGVTALATATAASPGQFVLWRCLTGLGLGAGIPNCNAWTAEYAPRRRRALILVLMNASIAAGAFCAAFLAPQVIHLLGWRGTFLIGGAAPLLLVLGLWSAPESLKFLAARRPQDRRIGRILRRLAPELAPVSVTITAQPGASARRHSPFQLVGSEYRSRTLLLWGVITCNLFVQFVLFSWLPTLLQAAGWAHDSALRGTAVVQAGGLIGGIVLSLFLDNGKTLPALRTAFVLAAICLSLFSLLPSGPLWVALLLVVGGGVSGSQLSLNVLSTAYYPPAIKATGMSWAGVIGNLGAVAGPLFGAMIMNLGFTPVALLRMLSLPMLLCAGAAVVMRREWQAH